MWKVIPVGWKDFGFEEDYLVTFDEDDDKAYLDATFESKEEAEKMCEFLNAKDMDLVNRIAELENQVYNLTLYLKYIQANCPEFWHAIALEEYFSGLGGYSERGND